MSHSAADGVAMVAAAQKTAASCRSFAARQLRHLHQGQRTSLQRLIGTITLVEGSLGRNDPTGGLEYPPPPDLSPEISIGNLARHGAQGSFQSPISSRAGRCWKEIWHRVAATFSFIWSAA